MHDYLLELALLLDSTNHGVNNLLSYLTMNKELDKRQTVNRKKSNQESVNFGVVKVFQIVQANQYCTTCAHCDYYYITTPYFGHLKVRHKYYEVCVTRSHF